MELLLERLGGNHNEWMLLKSFKKITVGRSVSSDIQLLSTFVSRSHASLERKSDLCADITDYNSLNGVSVNKVRISSGIPHIIKPGDTVEIGEPEDDFIMKVASLSDRFVYIVKAVDQEDLCNRPSAVKIHKSKLGMSSLTRKRKTEVFNDNNEIPKKQLARDISSTTEIIVDDATEEGVGKLRRNVEDSDKKLIAITEEHKKVVKEKETLEKYLMEMQLKYEEKLQEKNFFHHEKEDDLHEKFDAVKAALKKQEEVMRIKEHELTEHIQIQERFKEEFEKLQEELEKKEATLKEKQRLHEEELKRKETALQQKLTTEEKLWKEEVEQLKGSEIEEKAEQAKMGMYEVLEKELQCPICNELFVKATILNCSHTFCEYCIKLWRHQSSQSVCPVCRMEVTTLTRSLVVDNTIGSTVEKLPLELKEARETLVKARVDDATKLESSHHENIVETETSSSNQQQRSMPSARGLARRELVSSELALPQNQQNISDDTVEAETSSSTRSTRHLRSRRVASRDLGQRVLSRRIHSRVTQRPAWHY